MSCAICNIMQCISYVQEYRRCDILRGSGSDRTASDSSALQCGGSDLQQLLSRTFIYFSDKN